MVEQTLPEVGTSEVKNSSFKIKLIVGAVVLASCLLISLGYVIGVSVGRGNTPTPTTTPTPLVTETPKPTDVNPTASVTPTGEITEDPYEEWIEYVLADCFVKLYAPVEFLPGKRGDEGTCGTFKLGNDSFDGFDTYEGVMLVVVPFIDDREATYGFDSSTAQNYLDHIETDPERINNSNRDLLIGEIDENYVFAGQAFKKALIQRFNLGTAEHIFYEVFGGDYVVIWGGTQVEENAETIDLIIQSFEFIQPQQED